MKTIIGTPDKPWIDLTNHIDITGLHRLRLEIIRGIALSEEMNPSMYGQVLDSKFKDAYHTINYAKKSYNPEIRQHIEELTNMSGSAIDRRRRTAMYSNLVFGGYSSGWSIPVRSLPGQFADKNYAATTVESRNYPHFEKLMEWIRHLPFDEIGRVNIFLNNPYMGTPIHFDGATEILTHKNEFMWLTTEKKKFFLYDESEKKKYYIDSAAAFFDEMATHGTDADTAYKFSIRIDGVFTPELRKAIGIDKLENYCAKSLR